MPEHLKSSTPVTEDSAATDTEPASDTEPIDPNSTRERLRSWLGWLPVWFLMPIGLGPVDGNPVPGGDFHGGYDGPHDAPGLGGGYGDMGGGDFGGGF